MSEMGMPRKKLFHKGELIFKEGDMGNDAYVIDSGKVELFTTEAGERSTLAKLRDGALFGEMAIIDDSPRMASAEAMENTVVLVISSAILDAKLRTQDKFVRGLIRLLIDSLRGVGATHMRRPRSVTDYIEAMGSHLTGLRSYVEESTVNGLKENAINHLDAMERPLALLKVISEELEDQRESALSPPDLKFSGKFEPITMEED